MSAGWWDELCALLTRDLSQRGLDHALVRQQCRADFQAACQYLADKGPAVGIITGFYIPSAGTWESDGPPGAVFLARCLATLGYTVRLYAEPDLAAIHRLALEMCDATIPVVVFPHDRAWAEWWGREQTELPQAEVCFTVIERPGPAYTPDSLLAQSSDARVVERFLAQVPPTDWDRLHTMSGRDVTEDHWPVHHWLLESPAHIVAIGDGGNELGMGKLPWELIAEHVPNGARIACRVSADWLIVSAVSNWGAYALAAGVCLCREAQSTFLSLAKPDVEKRLWCQVCQRYPLCDGKTGQAACRDGGFWVDGYAWSASAQFLAALCQVVRSSSR